MNTIRELLSAKESSTVHTIESTATVFEAVIRMVEHNIGSLLVSENDIIKGVMTERDYLRLVTDQGRTARETPVSDIMTRRVVFITPDIGVDQAMAVMTEQRIRHLPVMDKGALVGIVSIGDLVKRLAHNQQAHIRFLEDYIADPYPGPAKG